MQSIDMTTYTPGEEIVFSDWAPLPDGTTKRVILCTACAIHHELTWNSTFFGHMGEAKRAEKTALQRMIDMGCTHIQRGGSMKTLSPGEIAGDVGGKGKSSKGGGAKGKK